MRVTHSGTCERCEIGPVAGYALAEPGATLMFIALCEKCLDTSTRITGRPGPRRLPTGKTERKVTGGKGDTEAKARKNAERAVMDAEGQCKQPLIEIDNRGERLKGCLTCNLWSSVDRKLWKRQ